jgi:hypothetical protein
MSTKKFGIVAGIVMTLSVVVSPAFAACSLTTLSECDNTGLMALVAQLLAGTSTTSTTTTGTSITGIPSGFTFTTNLKQGTTSNDVKYLQILLNSDSATSIGNAGKETTYFGAMTKAAVVKFQNKYASETLTPYGLTAGTGFFGSASRAKANALIASGTTGTGTTGTGTTGTGTTTATGAYTVSAAVNQPSGTLASGSAYNTVLRVNVSAGATAQSITSITVQRTGLSVDNKVAGVVIADENGARHGNIVTFASGVATINFASDPITVPAGTTKTISIQYNIDGTNGKSGTIGANVTTMSGTPAGLPLVGNTFTMVDSTGTVGSATIDVVALSTAAVTKDVGSTGYDIAKFKFTAGSAEDILVKKVTLYQNGNSSDADVSNIKLVAPDGTVLATVASSTNKYVTFDLTTSPYKIAKGNAKDLTVRIDIANGSSRTVQYVIQNDYDVVITGASTGVNVLPTATASVDTNGFPVGDYDGTAGHAVDTVSINAGSLIVQKSTTTPSGTLAVGGNSITLATWKFQARGEDIEIRKLTAAITGTNVNADNATGTYGVALSGTVRVVTEDGQILATIDPTTTGLLRVSQTGAIITLATYYTIPAGTTKNISLVVDTASTLDSAATLTGAIKNVYYKQLSTNAFATANSSFVSGNTLSASTANLTVAKNASLGNSSKVAGQSAVKIGSYLLQASSTESVNVSTLAVRLQTATDVNFTADFSTAPIFTNLTLEKSDGTVIGSSIGTAIVGNVADGYGAANSFSVSGQLTIPASSTVQVDVYADIPAGINGYLRSEIEGGTTKGISATGASSGVTADAPSSTQVGQTIAIVAGGTLTVAEETSGAASSSFLTTGLSGVEMGRIKLSATVEDMKVDRLEVRTVSGDGNLAQIKLLGTGLSTDPTSSLTNGKAVFTFASGSEINVPAYGSKVLTVVADTTNVGTITAGKLGIIGFGTANAKGAGSGNIVQETVVGTSKTYTVASDDGVPAAAAVGDILYFTEAAATGSVTPGFHMITAADNTKGGLTVSGGISLDGTAVTFTAGNVVSLIDVSVISGAAAEELTAINGSFAKGDVVYYYDDADDTAGVTTGWHVVSTAVSSGTTMVLDGTSFTVQAGDWITKLPNANALAGNTMQFEEVEPNIVKNSSSPSGTTSASSDQIVAMFDVTSQGSRDLTFSDITVEKGGSNSPAQYVTHLSLYNGSTKLAEVATTTATADTTSGAVASNAITVVPGDASAAANTLGGVSVAEYAKWKVGDTLTLVDEHATTVHTNTVRITSMSKTYGTTGAGSYGTDATASIGLSGTVTLDAGDTISIYNNRVHFNASQADTGDVALTTQTITAGQTLTLTVKADTSAVKTGVTGGASANLTMTVPGTAGPLTTDAGGLTWTYTALNAAGTAHTGSTADNYPVAANTLSY